MRKQRYPDADAGPEGTRTANKLREEYEEAHPIPEHEVADLLPSDEPTDA